MITNKIAAAIRARATAPAGLNDEQRGCWEKYHAQAEAILAKTAAGQDIFTCDREAIEGLLVQIADIEKWAWAGWPHHHG